MHERDGWKDRRTARRQANGREREETLEWARTSEREVKKINEEVNGKAVEEKIGRGIVRKIEEEREKSQNITRYTKISRETRILCIEY